MSNSWYSVQCSRSFILAIAGPLCFHCCPPSWQSLSGYHSGFKSQLSKSNFSSVVRREKQTEREKEGYKRVLSCPFWLIFCFNSSTIPFCLALQLQAQCLRRFALRGSYDSLSSFSLLSFLSRFSDVDSVILECACLVIMPIERVIPKAKEIEEKLNWRSVVMGKKNNFFSSPAVYLRTLQLENKILNLSTCFFSVFLFIYQLLVKEEFQAQNGWYWTLEGGLNKILPCNFTVQLTQLSKSMIRSSVALWVQIHTEPTVQIYRAKY